MRNVDIDDDDDEVRPIRRAKEVNPLGIAGFIFGVLALAVSWLPPYNQAVLPLGGIGLLLSVLGLVISFINRRVGSTWPATALLLCLMAFGLMVFTSPVVLEAIEREWTRQDREAKAPAPPPQAVAVPAPAPEFVPPPLPSNAHAKSELARAKAHRLDDNDLGAAWILRELVRNHPDTAEAEEARKQLAEMGR